MQTITTFRNPLADPLGTRRGPPLVRGPQFENRCSVGYGCQIPRTTAGRLISLPYAVVGIPLTFYFLSRAGRDLARFLETVYRRVCCDVVCCKLCQRRRRRQIYSPGGAGRRAVFYYQSPDGANYVVDVSTTTGQYSV